MRNDMIEFGTYLCNMRRTNRSGSRHPAEKGGNVRDESMRRWEGGGRATLYVR